MKYSVQEIKDNLLKIKSVYTSKGYSDVYDYVYFYNKRMWASNGFFLISVPTTVKDSFMVPAVPLEEQLKTTKETEFDITISPIDIVITIGKKKSVYAINDNFDTYVRKYGIGYFVEEDAVPVTTDLLSLLDFCGKTVYKDSVSYSYVYVQDNLAFSSDSFRISFMRVDDGLSGLKSPYGTRKHLIDTVDAIYYDNDTVSFFCGDVALTCALQESEGTKILEFNRKVTNTPVKIIDIDSFSEFLKLTKKITKSYKTLDQVLTITIDGNSMTLQAGDTKAVVTEEITVESVESVSFSIHPGFMEEALKISNTFFMDNNSIVVFNDKKKQFVSIEEK